LKCFKSKSPKCSSFQNRFLISKLCNFSVFSHRFRLFALICFYPFFLTSVGRLHHKGIFLLSINILHLVFFPRVILGFPKSGMFLLTREVHNKEMFLFIWPDILLLLSSPSGDIGIYMNVEHVDLLCRIL